MSHPIGGKIDERREALGLDYQQAVEVMMPFAGIISHASKWSDAQLEFFVCLAQLKRGQLEEGGEL